MKKTRILCLFLSLLMVLSACGDKSGGGGSTTENIAPKIEVETIDYYNNGVLLPGIVQYFDDSEQSYEEWIDYGAFIDDNAERENVLGALPFGINGKEDGWKIKYDDNSRFSNFTMTRENETVKAWKPSDMLKTEYESPAMRVGYEIVYEDLDTAWYAANEVYSTAGEFLRACLDHFTQYDTYYNTSFQYNISSTFYRVSIDKDRRIHFYRETGMKDYSTNENRFFSLPYNYDFFDFNSMGAGENYENLEEAFLAQKDKIQTLIKYKDLNDALDHTHDSPTWNFDAENHSIKFSYPLWEYTLTFNRDDKNKTSTLVLHQQSEKFEELRDCETALINSVQCDTTTMRGIVDKLDENSDEPWSTSSVATMSRFNYTYTVETTLSEVNDEGYILTQDITCVVKDPPSFIGYAVDPSKVAAVDTPSSTSTSSPTPTPQFADELADLTSTELPEDYEPTYLYSGIAVNRILEGWSQYGEECKVPPYIGVDGTDNITIDVGALATRTFNYSFDPLPVDVLSDWVKIYGGEIIDEVYEEDTLLKRYEEGYNPIGPNPSDINDRLEYNVSENKFLLQICTNQKEERDLYISRAKETFTKFGVDLNGEALNNLLDIFDNAPYQSYVYYIGNRTRVLVGQRNISLIIDAEESLDVKSSIDITNFEWPKIYNTPSECLINNGFYYAEKLGLDLDEGSYLSVGAEWDNQKQTFTYLYDTTGGVQDLTISLGYDGYSNRTKDEAYQMIQQKVKDIFGIELNLADGEESYTLSFKHFNTEAYFKIGYGSDPISRKPAVNFSFSVRTSPLR